METDRPIVEVKNVWKEYSIRSFWLKSKKFWALVDANLKIKSKEVIGILGESGCGKTTLGKIILGLEKPDKGEIFWFGKNLQELNSKEYKKFRPKIQAVFQDPYSSLNPRYKIKNILTEPYFININSDFKEALEKAKELLEKVGLGEEVLNKYPHELSGGQRQRVALARALMVSPQLIVLDEPTSALDMTIQAQILNLLKDLKNAFGLSYLIISHSLSVILYISDLIVVMYLGRIIEIFRKENFSKQLHHPYTIMLIEAYPDPFSLSPPTFKKIKGEITSPFERPKGCEFYPRCPEREDICKREKPKLKKINTSHYIACFKR